MYATAAIASLAVFAWQMKMAFSKKVEQPVHESDVFERLIWASDLIELDPPIAISFLTFTVQKGGFI